MQGTLTHMAPELLLHRRASKASDVYAFAILLWELYTARRAFQGGFTLLLSLCCFLHVTHRMGLST
jgi:serine/threonine protein kinase